MIPIDTPNVERTLSALRSAWMTTTQDIQWAQAQKRPANDPQAEQQLARAEDNLSCVVLLIELAAKFLDELEDREDGRSMADAMDDILAVTMLTANGHRFYDNNTHTGYATLQALAAAVNAEDG